MTPSTRSREREPSEEPHALGAAAPSTGEKPIGPGFSGGRYRPLGDRDVERIHQTSLDILERIGLADPIASWRDLVLAKGGWVNDTNRLCFPRAMVEDALAQAAHHFVLHGRDPTHDLDVSGSRVHFGGASATVQTLDIVTGGYRDTQLTDLYDYSRLEDALENMHFVIRQCIARDLEKPRLLDLNTAYAVMSGTSKHMATSFFEPDHLRETVAMFEMSLGGRRTFRSRPFAHAVIVVAVSPLRFSREGCAVLEAAVQEGMPAILISAGQSGSTSPAALAGALTQGNAEVLAALTFVNLLAPGHPVLFGNWPFVSDLRSGAAVGGGGEFGLLAAGAAQLGNYYDLPCGVCAGISDSKLPDAQSGWEKGFLTVMPGLAGANLVYEAAGVLASIMASSYEAFVIDNDMLSNVIRAVRGIEVNDDTLSFGAITEALEGESHFLDCSQTMRLMRTEYVYPRLADRQSIVEWQKSGAVDIRKRARDKVCEILSNYFPTHVDDATDAKIRAHFDIRLPREYMRPGKNRWYHFD